MQLQKQSWTFLLKKKSYVRSTTVLSWQRKPINSKSIPSFDNLTCTHHVDLDQSQFIFRKFFWSKNDFQHLDVKISQKFQKGWHEKFPINTKSLNGRRRRQSIRVTTKSISCLRRKFKQSEKKVQYGFLLKFEVVDEKLKLAQNQWRFGPSKQKKLCNYAAVQCGQAREFLCYAEVWLLARSE